MLSILIPIHNEDVNVLVRTLHEQCSNEDVEFEIICMDDGSAREVRKVNKAVSDLQNCLYKEVAINVGRSRIRNLLAQEARFAYLLYLDCDSVIVDNSFIKRYLSHLPTAKVLVGGRVYKKEKPESEFLLHWLVGTEREQRQDSGFQSNNFVISRKLFSQVRFSEEIKGYGHEDTLFGYQLAELEIEIAHIDNPVLHGRLEPAETFIAKQEAAVDNLIRLMAMYPTLSTRLSRSVEKLENRKISNLMTWGFKNRRARWRQKLLGPNPNLYLLDLYKLGYYLLKKSTAKGTPAAKP